MTDNGMVRKVGPALALLGILAGLLVWQHAGQGGPQVTALAGAGSEPLRLAFNRDADKVRLLLLLDPT